MTAPVFRLPGWKVEVPGRAGKSRRKGLPFVIGVVGHWPMRRRLALRCRLIALLW